MRPGCSSKAQEHTPGACPCLDSSRVPQAQGRSGTEPALTAQGGSCFSVAHATCSHNAVPHERHCAPRGASGPSAPLGAGRAPQRMHARPPAAQALPPQTCSRRSCLQLPHLPCQGRLWRPRSAGCSPRRPPAAGAGVRAATCRAKQGKTHAQAEQKSRVSICLA